MMTRPESEPTFCGDIGFDGPDWPGPWGCGTVMLEVVDGVVTRHLCTLSYDHVEYEGEGHVCVLGHRWDVEKPRRRWRDRLLRRPVEKLPQRRGRLLGSFWDDLGRHMENPEFRRSYVEQSLRIQATDEQANTDGR